VGLSISRPIIESHGGQIVAEPNPDGGTVVRFTFRGSLPKCQNPNTRQQAFTDNVLLSEATDVYVPDRGGSSQRLEYWKVAENNHGRIVQPGALLDGSLVAFGGEFDASKLDCRHMTDADQRI